MMRLIDADRLRETLQRISYDDWNQSASTSWAEAYSEIADMINAIPTVEAEPVRHGHWIMLHKTYNVDEDNDYDWRCSECNHVDCHNIKVEVPFCWYCGAKMDLDEVNNEVN